MCFNFECNTRVEIQAKNSWGKFVNFFSTVISGLNFDMCYVYDFHSKLKHIYPSEII